MSGRNTEREPPLILHDMPAPALGKGMGYIQPIRAVIGFLPEMKPLAFEPKEPFQVTLDVQLVLPPYWNGKRVQVSVSWRQADDRITAQKMAGALRMLADRIEEPPPPDEGPGKG